VTVSVGSTSDPYKDDKMGSVDIRCQHLKEGYGTRVVGILSRYGTSDKKQLVRRYRLGKPKGFVLIGLSE